MTHIELNQTFTIKDGKTLNTLKGALVSFKEVDPEFYNELKNIDGIKFLKFRIKDAYKIPRPKKKITIKMNGTTFNIYGVSLPIVEVAKFLGDLESLEYCTLAIAPPKNYYTKKEK